MIFAIAAIVAAVLIALDSLKTWRSGIAATTFGRYARDERPAAFWAVCGVKLLMSVVLVILASALLAEKSA